MKWAILLLLLARAAPAQDFGQTGQAVQDVNIVGGSVTLNMSSVTITGIVTTEGAYSLVNISAAVSGGTGSAVFSSTGTLLSCSLVPASPIAAYDFEILTNDADQFPVFGRAAIIGKAGLIGPRLLAGSHVAKFENATPDGTYKARCVVKR